MNMLKKRTELKLKFCNQEDYAVFQKKVYDVYEDIVKSQLYDGTFALPSMVDFSEHEDLAEFVEEYLCRREFDTDLLHESLSEKETYDFYGLVADEYLEALDDTAGLLRHHHWSFEMVRQSINVPMRKVW